MCAFNTIAAFNIEYVGHMACPFTSLVSRNGAPQAEARAARSIRRQ
jgi:hypothetical protein